MPTPQQTLQQYFGFDHFREGQEETIQRVLNGQHTLLVMPTGSGKSLTYQLPAMLQAGLTLVISPLIALMKDQVDSLVEAGIPATYINSTLPASEVNRRTRAILEGHIKLLYIAPERLRNRRFTRTLANTKVNLLAVDEAHCISQWGHDFRPDYLQIGPTWQAMGRPTLLATTATATPTVQNDIVKILGIENIHTTVTGFNRPNLTFRVIYAPDERTKLQALQSHLSKVKNGSAIVYASTRRNTDETADYINDVLQIPAGAYHAGLDRNIRHQVQNDFMNDRIKVVVATNAFGMGVDKPDVRAVIHYNMPANVEAYYQEAGRAGRDGQPAQCIMFFSPDDQRLQEWMINSDTPTHDDLHQLYTRLFQAANSEDNEVYFSNEELSQITGLHPVKIRVTLSELEQAGIIYHLGDQSGYSHWKVLPLSNDALNQRAKAIDRRAKIRHQLLDTMLNYVNLTTCRRLFLLNYFGDASPPRSPHCCDNHTVDTLEDLPKAVTPQEWFPLIVLETVRTFQERPVGRKRLAQLLNGSQAKGIEQFGYTRHKFYGKLSGLSQSQITALIDSLISGRYLRISGGELPVVTLTDAGAKALDARAALPISVSGAPSRPKHLPAERTGTIEITQSLLQEGLTPAQIADKRDLTEQTIYTHLARLIGLGEIELHNVVSPEIETQVLEAVVTIGSADQLTPIKTALPEDISFDQIKCVLVAHPELPRESAPNQTQRPTDSPSPLPPAPRPPAPNSPPDVVILDAVAKLGGTLGRTGLAQFLSGSQIAWLETFANHSCYGQLSHLSQKAILNIIDALITDGKLVTTGGGRPKVVLPDQLTHTSQTQNLAGTTPEKPTKTDDPESKKDSLPPVNLGAAPEKVKDSPPDADLFETLRAWRTEQAKAQQVPPYVVFSNKVLEAIAARKPVTLHELSEISGIGPAKLEKYGDAVIAIVTAGDTNPRKTPAPEIKPLPNKPADHPPISHPTLQTPSPKEAILAVASDLDGLLTAEGLAQLLTAGPDEVVSFSDHKLYGAFYPQTSTAEMMAHIQKCLQSGQLLLTTHQRLMLP